MKLSCLIALLAVFGLPLAACGSSHRDSAAPTTSQSPESSVTSSPTETPTVTPSSASPSTPLPTDAKIIPHRSDDSALMGDYCTLTFKHPFLKTTVTRLKRLSDVGDPPVEVMDIVQPGTIKTIRPDAVIFYIPGSHIYELTYNEQVSPAGASEPSYDAFTYLMLKDATDPTPKWEELDLNKLNAPGGFVASHPDVSLEDVQTAADNLANLGWWYFNQAEPPKPHCPK